MKRTTAIAALLALLVSFTAATVVPTGAARAADPVTVDWPATTHVNPTVDTYTFTVTSAPADAHLFYTWGVPDALASQITGTPVAVSEQVTADFTGLEGQGALRVWECPDATWSTDCTESARSPLIDAWWRARIIGILNGAPLERGVGPQKATFWWGPKPPLALNPTGTWELLDDGNNPLKPAVGGTMTDQDFAVTKPSKGISTLRFDLPAGIPSGLYHLDMHIATDTTDFGHLEGSLRGQGRALPILIDQDPPELTVRGLEPRLYPERDRYLDHEPLQVRSSEQGQAWVEVLDSSGRLVYQSTSQRIDGMNWLSSESLSWNGRIHGAVAPEGRYTLKVVAQDFVKNTATWAAAVTVSHKKLQWVDFQRTVPAAATVVGKPLVGACSTLASPYPGGPRGSLGFYSSTKCRRSDKSAQVDAVHGMYIPVAFDKQWDTAQVTVNGGPAGSSDWLELGYLRPNSKKLWDASYLKAGNGAHPGREMGIGSAHSVFDDDTSKPYLLWFDGLTAGSRYNVRSYTLRVHYQTLK